MHKKKTFIGFKSKFVNKRIKIWIVYFWTKIDINELLSEFKY